MKYIGSRYVPKFMGNYNATQAYEALSVVDNGMGTSYISNKPTPAGTPLTDTAYWTVYGSSSGAIINLQNQIDLINAKLFNKKYVVMTDSYGNYTNSDGRNFIEDAFYKLGITDYYEFHRGSAGFCRTGSLNFLSVLTDNENVITDKDEITDIMVLGGANDQVDPSLILSGINTFVTYVRANYPNAKVTIGNFTITLDPTYITALETCIAKYKDACLYGVRYIQNGQYIMRNLNYFQNDNVHPSADGIDALSKYLQQYLINDYVDVRETDTSATVVSLDTDYTIVGDNIQMEQHNDVVTINNGSGGIFLNFKTTAGFTLSKGINTLLNKFEINQGYLYAAQNNRVNLQGIYTTGSADNGQLEIVFSKIASGNSSKFGMFMIAPDVTAIAANTTISLMLGTMTFSLDLS